MKLRENKTICLPPDILNRRARSIVVRADYSTARPWHFPEILFDGSPNKTPAALQTPGGAPTWRQAAAFSIKNQFRILKTHYSAIAQILSHANGCVRSTMSDVFCASTQDCLSNTALEQDCFWIGAGSYFAPLTRAR
jgi:hypothetical protein